MSENKSKRKYIVVAIVAALLLVGGTITAVCIANSNNNAVQVAEQSDNSSVQSSVAESSIENTNTESSAVSENSTKENSATAETSKTAQESSNTSSKAETSKTETSSKPETSKAESSTTTQQSQQPTNNNNQTSKPSTSTETSKPSTSTETSKPSTSTETSKPTTIAVTSISLDRSSVTLTVGDKVTLVATVNPGNATNKSYEFSSSNNDVATVNSSGTVVAKKAGSCTITVKSSNGKTAKCSVTVKAKTSTGNTSGNGGTSSTGKSGVASIPAGAKSYQTKSYNGKKTYTVYECPEVVKYINEYRKKAGLKEVKWNTLDYMNQHAYDTVFSIPKEVEYVKRYDPETYEKAFDKNGNYVGAYDYNDWFDATQNNRNAVAYMLGTNAIYHADEHQWSAGIQFTGGSKFSPSSWISNMKTSPDHWEMIMCEDATAVYCTYGVTSNGYFYVAISMI